MQVGNLTALKGFLQEEWQFIKEELLAGRYHLQTVKKVEIPKPGSDTRVQDIRLIIELKGSLKD